MKKYYVKSNSNAGEHIVIEDFNGKFICDCKGYKFNREKTCSHIQEVKNKIMFYKEKEELKNKIETEIKLFRNKYEVVPQIKIKNNGSVEVKFIF